jgi:hypothetical protein
MKARTEERRCLPSSQTKMSLGAPSGVRRRFFIQADGRDVEVLWILMSVVFLSKRSCLTHQRINELRPAIHCCKMLAADVNYGSQ